MIPIVRRQMDVPGHRERDIEVTELLLRVVWQLALLHQQRAGGVPGVLHGVLAELGRDQQRIPDAAAEVVVFEIATVSIWEHKGSGIPASNDPETSWVRRL